MPLKDFAAGIYNWLRVSLAYQNYNVYVNGLGQTTDATVASFIGYRTYLNSFKIKDSTIVVNSNKDQGYWATEGSAFGFGMVQSGQAPYPIQFSLLRQFLLDLLVWLQKLLLRHL